MMRHALNPVQPFLGLWRHRHLLVRLTRREIASRYRGSMLGLLWTLLTPLLMLGIFTFVFGVIFRMRWDFEQSVEGPFAAILFSGLIIHGIIGEVLGRGPLVVLSNVNYVKKVLFPLELLSWVIVITAVFHFFLAMVVLLVFLVVVGHGIPLTALAIPVVVLPFVFLALGVSWFVASLGVYIRDTVHVTAFFTTALLFLSPIFYPLSAVPEPFQGLFLVNPLTHVINEFRHVLLGGQWPEVGPLLAYWLVSMIVFWFGYLWFQATRDGFSDVL